ncbi:Lrp/AsnC family transcriptional regulator [Rubrobacter naiadicus]|uniref:Lrp/AsnC family transcriptional regulator n=1 Tax=Rubrobacter naiadicus TaxID=1392641 RepID=UPI002361DD8C|nr:Lrp/AsnC family transcriptional regulator [Rubrobacter naiadicus]
MSRVSLDAIDKKILSVLQDNARIPNTELADAVSLTPAPCLRRVKRLEEMGLIDGYVTLLNHEAVGRNFHVFVEVTLQKQTREVIDRFEAEVKKLPEVLECYLITGDSDYLLRVAVEDMDAYQRFLMDHLTHIRDVDDIKSVIAMKQVKYSTKLPLD